MIIGDNNAFFKTQQSILFLGIWLKLPVCTVVALEQNEDLRKLGTEASSETELEHLRLFTNIYGGTAKCIY